MKIENRKAKFNYEIIETLEAGIKLAGAEVKAIRAGKVNLDQAYVKVMGGEAYLVNANFSVENADSTRSRKLLLHKRQIVNLELKTKTKKLTVIPLKLYNKGPLFKLEIALVRSRRKHSKKEVLKKRDLDRQMERELKDY